MPRTYGQYLLAALACIFVAVFYEALQVFITLQELKWAKESSKADNPSHLKEAFGTESECTDCTLPSTPMWKQIGGLSRGSPGVQVALCRGILRMISTTIGYALMLLSMTFNVGLFFAIVGGFGLGTFLFAPIARSATKSFDIEPSDSTGCH